MVISYKHLRIKYEYSNINIWTNHTQYYRTLLRAHSICMPSITNYMLVYTNNSNRIEFKSRQLANKIGKFVYFYTKFIKIYSYVYKLFKKIIDTKLLRSRYYKRYRGKTFIRYLRIKHFILLIKQKIKNKMRKHKRLMWRFFYSIPGHFWNNSAKKRIKSIIWLLFFKKNNKIPKKYLEINAKRKGHLYFFNYNRISNLIHYTFKRKRLPRNEWLMKKHNYYKKKKKRKFGIYFHNNLYEDKFLNISSINVYKKIYNQINNYRQIANFNNYYLYNTFINMYCFLLYYIKLSNFDNNIVNLYYLYLSKIYKERAYNKNKNNIIRTYYYNKINNIKKKNANNAFNINIWYNIFTREHNTYTYFNINGILIYKKNINISNDNYINITKYINNIFFIKKNISYINKQNTIINNKQYKIKVLRKKKYKIKLLKKRKLFSYTIIPIIYNKLINKIYLFKKKNNLKLFNQSDMFRKSNEIRQYSYNNKIIKKYIRRRRYYYRFRRMGYMLRRYFKKKSKNKNIIKTKTYNISIYFNKINNHKTKKYVININTNNNIYFYKNIHYYLMTNSFLNGYKTRIISKNNILYLHFFNNNIIYKEIVSEYNTRIHSKNNKYEHFFILNRNIIIFITRKINIGNIINGIHLLSNCIYFNNKINTQYLLYNINKYSNTTTIPIYTYINKQYRLINNK
jgi:hypothetical protein